jgi:hypothetical protein
VARFEAFAPVREKSYAKWWVLNNCRTEASSL